MWRRGVFPVLLSFPPHCLIQGFGNWTSFWSWQEQVCSLWYHIASSLFPFPISNPISKENNRIYTRAPELTVLTTVSISKSPPALCRDFWQQEYSSQWVFHVIHNIRKTEAWRSSWSFCLVESLTLTYSPILLFYSILIYRFPSPLKIICWSSTGDFFRGFVSHQTPAVDHNLSSTVFFLFSSDWSHPPLGLSHMVRLILKKTSCVLLVHPCGDFLIFTSARALYHGIRTMTQNDSTKGGY